MPITKEDMYTSDDVRVRDACNIARILCVAHHGYGTERSSVCWPCQQAAMELVNDWDAIQSAVKVMARRRPDTWLPVGSISTGTLRMEDLIPAMLDAGDCIHMTRDDRSEMRKLAGEYRRVEEDDWFLSEEAVWFYDELVQLLDGYCPPFTYLGSH
jgi:hypothetical protein